MKNNNPKSRQESLVVQEFEKEVLIYDLKINKAYCLNEISQLVWQLCDGNNSIADISRSLSKQLKTDVSEDLIWLALDQFKRDDLLDKPDELEINFGGLNRRQVIRKVGFASLVALPMVASVVAPSAVMAQSGGIPLFSTCSTPLECNSGNCISGPFFGTPGSCCVSTTIMNNAAGLTGTSFCTNSMDCSGLAESFCCSGTATFRPDLPTCGGPTSFPCVCN